MVSGYEEVLRHFDEARLNRVLLLSDGLANRGVVDRAEILERARRCHERGVRVSSMGMGLHYDEALMSGIAAAAGGNYYYVDQAESVGEFLDREIDELTRIVARDVEVSVALGEGVELLEVLGHRERVRGAALVVPISDMYSGEQRKLVLAVRVHGENGSTRPLATASVRFRDAVSNEPQHEVDPALEVGFTESADAVAAARRPEVLVKVEVIRNAEALIAAMELQKKGDFAGARELLAARHASCKAVNDAEYRSAELTRMLETLERVMRDIERTRADVRARRDLQLATGLEGLGYLE
jgi:Ca-activated chloride channel family protein